MPVTSCPKSLEQKGLGGLADLVFGCEHFEGMKTAFKQLKFNRYLGLLEPLHIRQGFILDGLQVSDEGERGRKFGIIRLVHPKKYYNASFHHVSSSGKPYFFVSIFQPSAVFRSTNCSFFLMPYSYCVSTTARSADFIVKTIFVSG